MSQTIFPTLRYRDAKAAIAFLESAFGFERHAVHEEDGIVGHAELRLGDSMIMLGQERDGGFGQPAGTGSAYVVIADPDAHHARAVAAGAEVVYGPVDQDYGSREYAAHDSEGNLWSFGTYDPWAAA
jgi:uncharacterized glyoxalase superfamily protein PhnB